MTSELDFLNTLGRELCAAIETEVPDATSLDCYSALIKVTGEPVTLQLLKGLATAEYDSISTEFCRFFEVDGIEPGRIKEAISATLDHWDA